MENSLEYIENFLKKYVDHIFISSPDIVGFEKQSKLRLVGYAKYGRDYYYLLEIIDSTIGNFAQLTADSSRDHVFWESSKKVNYNRTYTRLRYDEFPNPIGWAYEKPNTVEESVSTYWNF